MKYCEKREREREKETGAETCKEITVINGNK